MMKFLARSLAAVTLLTTPAMAQTVSNGPWANALGTVNDAASKCYAGTGQATIPALLCGIYFQAAQTSIVGTSIAAGKQVPGFQGIANGYPLTVTGTVTTQSSNSLASPAYRIPVSASGTNATNFFAGAKKAFHIRFCNVSTSFRSVKLYDKASAPTVGTDVPVATIPAPANLCSVIDWTNGFPFANGLSLAITGGAADADTTAIASGDIVGLNIDHN